MSARKPKGTAVNSPVLVCADELCAKGSKTNAQPAQNLDPTLWGRQGGRCFRCGRERLEVELMAVVVLE